MWDMCRCIQQWNNAREKGISEMNKFTGVLLLGTALLAGCVDREGYYNSVREEESHGLTSLRGQPALRYSDDWSP